MIDLEIQSKYYKQIHTALIAVDDECRIDFSKRGMSILLVDPANVLIGKISIPKKAFESFEVTKPVSIGYVLKLFETDDEQKMFLNSKGNLIFNISQDGVMADEIPITRAEIKHDIFTDMVTLLAEDRIRKKPKPPELNISCSFGLEVTLLRKLIKRETHIRFSVTDGNLICHGTPNWHTDPIPVQSKEIANTMFSNDYLKDIVKAVPQTVKTVKMTMGIDYPCNIEFDICDGMGHVKYWLAPRIESE